MAQPNKKRYLLGGSILFCIFLFIIASLIWGTEYNDLKKRSETNEPLTAYTPNSRIREILYDKAKEYIGKQLRKSEYTEYIPIEDMIMRKESETKFYAGGYVKQKFSRYDGKQKFWDIYFTYVNGEKDSLMNWQVTKLKFSKTLEYYPSN